MVTDQQNLQNLGSASRLAKIDLGLDLVPVADWSDEDMVAYIATMRDYILENPQAFNAQSMSLAQGLAQKNLSALLEPGWVNGELQDLNLLKYELTNNVLDAGADLARLGQGTLKLIGSVGGTMQNVGETAEHAAGTASWILPAVAVALLIVLIKEPSRGIALAGGAARAGAGAARSLIPI